MLWGLHGYLIPSQRLVSKAADGSTNIKKYTITDSQESFLHIAKSHEQLEDHLRFKTAKCENIQPHILAIGDTVSQIKEVYVFFDNIKFPFKSFIRAVDICFKIFFLFNLEYPKASEMC